MAEANGLTSLLLRYAHRQQPISLKHVEDVLRQTRFTGDITFHYRNGMPLRIEAGRPLTVLLLTEGEKEDACRQQGDLTTHKT